MVKYIIKRVLLGILTLFVLIAITFAMTKVMPGSPLQSKNISGDVLKKMEATYGLDKPPVEQFIIYCKNLLHGDMGTSSAVARQTQNSYEEVVKQDYITMAKAKGISKRTLLFRHILKNAMLPVITYMGPMIAFLLTGSVVIEQIYTIPGIGKEFVSAITNHDYTVVMGITIFIGAIIIICNLLSDLICAVVDPRVRKTL